jgi:hypothetical protein
MDYIMIIGLKHLNLEPLGYWRDENGDNVQGEKSVGMET